jgi:hypothetical protein
MNAIENLWRVDDVRLVIAAIRERGIRPDDPGFRGELRRLFENPGVRVRYCRRSGLSVDALAEMLWDRGFTTRRLLTIEVIDILEQLLAPAVMAARRRRSAGALTAIERDAQRAAKNRERKFQCPECHQIGRGSRASSFLCGVCYEMHQRIVAMLRVDPLPEEILQQAANTAA